MIPVRAHEARAETPDRARRFPLHGLRLGWHWLMYFPLLVYAVVSLYPFVWMLATSLKGSQEASLNPTSLLPNDWQSGLGNYSTVWNELQFFRQAINSLIIASGVVLVEWVFYGLAGYGLGVLKFPGRDKIFLAFNLLFFVPGVTILIPLVYLLRQLHLAGTLWGIVLPLANGAAPVAIFLLRNYFRSISAELRESAILDGASEMRVWGQIYMPLALPALTYLGITAFISGFRELILPLLTITDPSSYPLTLGIYGLNQSAFVQYQQLMTGSIILLLPVLAVFFVFQRYYIAGLTLGAVTG
jgi:multiple sugar transport system permease protein